MSDITDDKSEIAARLSCSAKSWARHDALDARDPVQEMTLILDAINELLVRQRRIAGLERALDDAIKSPMGVVPASAEKFYDGQTGCIRRTS